MCTDNTRLPPTHRAWYTTTRFKELESLQVFLPTQFSLFCAFKFMAPTKGVTLSLRSFLPKEQKDLEWSLERLIGAVLNLQTVCAIIFGEGWNGVFERATSALRAGTVSAQQRRSPEFIVHAIDSQLFRLGQTLAARWTECNATHYQIDNLQSTDDVLQLAQHILLFEIDVSQPTYFQWTIEKTITPPKADRRQQSSPKTRDKAKTPGSLRSALKKAGTQTPSPNRRNKRNRDAVKSVLSGDTNRDTKRLKKAGVKKVEFKEEVVESDNDSTGSTGTATPTTPTSTKICYNNLCGALKVTGHGRLECKDKKCDYTHEFDPSRKADYVRIAYSKTFNVPKQCKEACQKAADAMSD